MIARLVVLVVLMAGAGTAAGAEFGRMFFTPAQRAALDTFRKLNIRNATVSDDDIDKDLTPPPAVPEHMSVNGVVRRSDGRNTVWINQRAIGAQQAAGIKVAPGKDDNRVKLTVPKSGHSFDLKVGQTVEILSGTIEEGYSRRATARPEPAPADNPAATGGTTPQPQAATPPRAPDLQTPLRPGQPAQAEAGPAK